jgi:2-desacetyl-2-hydroxyethyl bacteriochlorophyllide A dehydrogenase
VFVEPRVVAVREIELPDPGDGDVVVKTLYSGISAGTEVWSLTGQYWSTKFPTLPGYQKVGVVERIGKDVREYAEGDLVFLRFTRVNPGTNIEWAGHTGRSVVSQDEPEMFKLPTHIDMVAASQVCVPAVAYHGVCEVMPIERGQRVAVIGLGPIGLYASQYAALRGATVFALDLVETRRELAAKLAGAIPLRGDKASIAKQFADDPLDAVIDTSAHSATVNDSFHWLRHGGRYCLQGYYPGLTGLDLLWPHAKELVFYNPTNCTPVGLRQVARDIADGRLKVREAISHVVTADEAPAMYQRLMDKDPSVFSAVIDWQGED